MKKFELELINTRRGLYKRITLIILFINFIFFIYGASVTTDQGQKKWFVFGAVVILITVVFNWYRQRRNPGLPDTDSGNFIAVAFAWAVLKNYWVAAAHLVLMILYIKANGKKIIQFIPSGIYIQSWPGKKIQWDSVSGVILKDGVLTIDYKNNKLLQANVVEKLSIVEEQAFNQFCHDRINLKLYTPS